MGLSLKEVISIQKDLTDTIFGHTGLQNVMEALNRHTGKPCCVLDLDHRILARSGYVVDSGTHAQVGLPLRDLNHLSSFAPFEGAPAAVSPIRAGHEVLGLVAIGASKEELSDLNVFALHHACTACALFFLNQKALTQAEMRLKGDFVWALATGSNESVENLISRGRYLGYDLTRLYQAMLLDLDDYKGYLLHTGVREESEIQRIKERITSVIESTALANNRKVMVTNQQDSYIVFLEIEPEREPGDIECFARRLQENVARVFPALTLSCGIGRFHPSMTDLNRGYKEAEKALKIGKIVRGRHSVTRYETLGSYRILFRLAEDGDAVEFCSEYLGKIVEYDRRRKGELLKTLRAFVENTGNVSGTARDLHLHRQSLLYRLERIEQLTGLDLEDPRDRFVLELSIRLLDIVKTL